MDATKVHKSEKIECFPEEFVGVLVGKVGISRR